MWECFCHLQEEGFIEKLYELLKILGVNQFVMLMCNSVACKLQEEGFIEKLHEFLNLLGVNWSVMFMCNSVVC